MNAKSLARAGLDSRLYSVRYIPRATWDIFLGEMGAFSKRQHEDIGD
jgi:hypothetical protein